MASDERIVIVGAGVFGAAAALELRRRGRAVLLLERGVVPHPDASSTDVSKVVRPDYGADEVYTEMALEALDIWEEWGRTEDPSPWHPDGFLVLAGSRMAPGGFEWESRRLLRERGVQLEAVDADALRRRHPAWNAARYPEGYLNPRAGWAESAVVVERLVERARRAGADVRTGIEVERVDTAPDGAVRGVRLRDGERVAARSVVVAAGAWTPALLPDLSNRLWATAQYVVHLHVADPAAWSAPDFPTWAADVARTGWYGFPALPDGRLKIGHHGPGRRLAPDEPAPDRVPAEHEEHLRDFLEGSLPALVDAPVAGSRVCLYCDTFDGDFWIARDPVRSGLTVAAGGSGHGFKFAPLLGPLIADAVEGRENRWAARFAWRSREDRVRAEPARMLR